VNINNLLFYLLLFPVAAFGQGVFLGNPSGALDSAWIDPLNFTENPASSAAVSSPQAGLLAGQFKDVKGLNFFSAGVAIPIKKIVIAVVINHFGTSGYQQNNINVLMSKNLGAINIGLMFRCELIAVESVDEYALINFRAGITKAAGQLTFGASLHGIGSTTKQENATQIQRLKVSSQCLFRVSSLVSFGLSGSKQAGQSVSIQPAIYYRAGFINFSLGFDSYSNNIFLLTGCQYKGYEFKMMLGYQATLGLINGAEVLYKRSR
jgi:hypothetical protein